MSAMHPAFSVVELLESRLVDSSYRKGEKARFSLMKAAAELLGDRPFSEIRNTDICQQANVSAGLLNSYFTDKHDLLVQLLVLFFDNFRKEYEPRREWLRNETDEFVKMYDRIKYMVEACQRNLGVFRLLVLESPDFPNTELTRLRESAGQFWLSDLVELIPKEKAGVKLSIKDRSFIAGMVGGMNGEAFRSIILAGAGGGNYLPKDLVEILAVLRYSCIFGADPSVESRLKARSISGNAAGQLRKMPE